MATCEITISIPDDLAASLSLRVPADEREQFVAEALRKGLRSKLTPKEEAEREEMFRVACELANNDPETLEIEREMASLPDTMTEEWDDVINLPKAG